MKFGYWTPIFGGWLRNVVNEDVPVSFEYVKTLAQLAENSGFDLTLVPELNLNDIKGIDAPTLDAWATAIAIATNTSQLEILVALRPIFHPVAYTAKQVTTIAEIANNRFSLNLVSAWWQEEAKQYAVSFPEHAERYALTAEYVQVLRGLWSETPFSYQGKHFQLHNTHLEPKPSQLPRIYAGGESEIGRDTIAGFADVYLTHGGTVTELAKKKQDMDQRRISKGLAPYKDFGMAAYVIVRDTEAEALQELERISKTPENSAAYASYQDFISKSKLDTKVSQQDYAVSNRGLRPNLIGTPQQIVERLLAFEQVGVNIVLLQFSPVRQELIRFAEQVIPLYQQQRRQLGLTND